MRLLTPILLGGLCAGFLDIVYAFVVYGPLSYGVTPEQVLQSVAAGWIGRDAARAGGAETAALGLGTHFLIATLMAAAFVAMAARAPALSRAPLLWGILYGLGLYVAMNYVVVPLSAAATGHFPADASEIAERLQTSFSMLRPRFDPDYPWMIPGTVFTHTVLVGAPIAVIAGRWGQQA